MEYSFNQKDFDRAFAFCIDYYIDPKKGQSDRTSGGPRGLGAVIDAFMRGKLVEIGAQRMIEQIDQTKKIELDFSIKTDREAGTEPDIVGVDDNGKKREPNFFIEVKNFKVGDRWLGLTVEQLKAIQTNSKGKDSFIIYITLKPGSQAGKISDLLGMYLNKISQTGIFNKFEILACTAELIHVLPIDDLKKYGRAFNAGDVFFETELFQPASIHKADGQLRSGVKMTKILRNGKGKIKISRYDKKDASADLTEFQYAGDFDIYEKSNLQSKPCYIFCQTDVFLENDIFGRFSLGKGKVYEFNLKTIGRDPVLNRDNLWISVRRLQHLISDKQIANPDSLIQKIAKEI